MTILTPLSNSPLPSQIPPPLPKFSHCLGPTCSDLSLVSIYLCAPLPVDRGQVPPQSWGPFWIPRGRIFLGKKPHRQLQS